MSRNLLAALMLVFPLLIGLLAPSSAKAAAIEITAPVQADFDKTTAAADGRTAARMKGLYADFKNLQSQDATLETQIKATHYRNEETLLALRKQIKAIDADKLAKLEDDLAKTKTRLKPLFDLYSAVNKQISLARAVKSSALGSILRAQADGMKPAVQLAKEEIKRKDALLKAAKSVASQKTKTIRETFSQADPLKVQITAQRSAAGLPRKSLSPVWTNFKYAAKKAEQRSATDALETLVSLSKQVVAQQQKIQALENKVADVYARAKAQLAAY